ncbi:hypothetical protein NPIL_7121 [Nephila pilipes]|uniref:Uncharacterized protein n=1 Tax=Nephila pilipes TaxID=299642 RepID=A0A8X6PAR6_NEPPI|nr:hypothetical protein NPIL_7121 [Nephila pilipes]
MQICAQSIPVDNEQHYWSDLLMVLSSSKKNLPIFVNNRVQEVRELDPISGASSRYIILLTYLQEGVLLPTLCSRWWRAMASKTEKTAVTSLF